MFLAMSLFVPGDYSWAGIQAMYALDAMPLSLSL